MQWKAESIGSLDAKIAAGIEIPEDLEREVYKAEEVKDTLIERRTRLKRYLGINKPSSEPSAMRNVTQSSTASCLPKLNLPTFSGVPIKWQSFWDSFEAPVHTNANHERSVSLLKSRFSKKERIITADYQALLDLEAPSNAAFSL